MSGLVVAPVLVPIVAAVATLLLPHRAQRAASIIATLTSWGISIALVWCVAEVGEIHTALGGWLLPYAIELRADRTSALFVLLTATITLAAVGFEGGDRVGSRASAALRHGFVAGAAGVFLTADLFNLYVWFEVSLVAALGMLTANAGPRQLDATFRYFVLNAVGTVFLLIGVASVYAVTGHLNFAALRLASASAPPAALAPIAVLLTTAFLAKAAAFPAFAWLPASYPSLAPAQLALFAAVGTKLGVYAILRISGDVLFPVLATHRAVLGWIALATLVSGVLGAAYHWDLRRILAFHSVSQVGYMLLGVALGTAAGGQAAIMFAFHHVCIKANLFLIAAVIAQQTGSYDLRRAGGLFALRPWLAAVFLSQALSLVGVPPSSGFWAKFLLLRESLYLGRLTWAAIALGVGLLTLYSMVKIWTEVYWKDHPDKAWKAPALSRWMIGTVTGVALITLAIGLWPEPLIAYLSQVGEAAKGSTP